MRVLRLAAAIFLLLGVPGRPASAGHLRMGVLTPLDRVDWSEVRSAWREIEALGFDDAWVNDHLLAPDSPTEPHLEAWTTLAALANETRKLDVGVLVSGNTYRNPALLAKMATTVDQISNGRLVLGIGAAWCHREHEAYGFPFGTARERATRLAEALEVITILWQGGGSFQGEHYSLDEAPFAPPNVRTPRPPLIVGGQGKQWIVPLAGRYADGWNAAPSVTPEGFRERVEIIEKECASSGRPACPTRLSKVFQLRTITDAPLPADAKTAGSSWVLAGNPAQVAAQIQQFTDAGANEIVLMLPPPYDLETLRRFSRDVVPLLDGGPGTPAP